jgi:hypothetical protein
VWRTRWFFSFHLTRAAGTATYDAVFQQPSEQWHWEVPTYHAPPTSISDRHSSLPKHPRDAVPFLNPSDALDFGAIMSKGPRKRRGELPAASMLLSIASALHGSITSTSQRLGALTANAEKKGQRDENEK